MGLFLVPKRTNVYKGLVWVARMYIELVRMDNRKRSYSRKCGRDYSV